MKILLQYPGIKQRKLEKITYSTLPCLRQVKYSCHMRCLMLYLVIFLLLFLFYIVMFWIEIKAAIEYIRDEQDEWLEFSFYTRNGIIRYRKEIPLVKTNKDKVKFKLVKGQSRKMRTGTAEKEKLMPLDIYRKYISVRTYLKDHEKLIRNIREYINKKDIHVELKIKLKQGMGDAAQTGLICGLLWAAAGIVISHLSRYLKAFKKVINITPCFEKAVFDVDASCIFHAKLVHIIVVLIKIYSSKYLIKLKSKKMIGGEISG